MKSPALIFLAIFVAGVIRATEVIVCEWDDSNVYVCNTISQEDKKPLLSEPEEPLVFEPMEEVTDYGH